MLCTCSALRESIFCESSGVTLISHIQAPIDRQTLRPGQRPTANQRQLRTLEGLARKSSARLRPSNAFTPFKRFPLEKNEGAAYRGIECDGMRLAAPRNQGTRQPHRVSRDSRQTQRSLASTGSVRRTHVFTQEPGNLMSHSQASYSRHRNLQRPHRRVRLLLLLNSSRQASMELNAR